MRWRAAFRLFMASFMICVQLRVVLTWLWVPVGFGGEGVFVFWGMVNLRLVFGWPVLW